MGSATGFASVSGATVQGIGVGSYAGVSVGTAATFTPFSFNALTVTPLWTFNFGGLTYSFDATSVVVDLQNNTFIDLSGTGLAVITKTGGGSAGFTTTAGTWSFVGTQQGRSSATWASAASAPEGGATSVLIGLGLAGICLFSAVRRKRHFALA
jgi:hypothetical protein